MKDALAPYSKAIAGFVGSVATALGASMADGQLTSAEVIIAVGAGLIVGGGIVYAAPANTIHSR